MYQEAVLNGAANQNLIEGKTVTVTFPGNKLKDKYYRNLGELTMVDVPEDAEALYEATVYAADNNALEIRSHERSGPSNIPAVKAAREAFLNQPLFAARGLWDDYMFDGDKETSFYVSRRTWSKSVINKGSLRIDFGKAINLDQLVIDTEDEHGLQPWKFGEAARMEISTDLKTWTYLPVLAGPIMKAKLDASVPVRYIRFRGTPDKVVDVKGFGRQRGHTELYRGAEYQVDFIPKIKLEIATRSENCQRVVETITKIASTGKIGDGKIFVYDLDQIVRIRTGELDEEAI